MLSFLNRGGTVIHCDTFIQLQYITFIRFALANLWDSSLSWKRLYKVLLERRSWVNMTWHIKLRRELPSPPEVKLRQETFSNVYLTDPSIHQNPSNPSWLRESLLIDVFFFWCVFFLNPSIISTQISRVCPFFRGQNLLIWSTSWDPEGSKEWSHHPICLRDVCRCTCGSLDAGILP